MTKAMAILRLTIMSKIYQDLLVNFQYSCYYSVSRLKNFIGDIGKLRHGNIKINYPQST